MPLPPSVTKIKKDGVEFTSSVDRCSYTIKELCRAALRDAGKFVVKEFRKKYYGHFKRHTGEGGRATRYKVIASKSTLYPRVQIGLPHATKKNPVKGYYAYFQELGTKNIPKLGFLQSSVEENVTTIIKIQSQYLSALEDEAEALALISEDDYEGGAEE